MITFLVIGAVGIVLLLVSLVVGDFLDGALEFGGDLFGGAALAGFLGAFGFGGALAHSASGGNLAVSVIVGLVVGVLIGAAVGYASSALKRGGDESNIRSADLAGPDLGRRHRPAVAPPRRAGDDALQGGRAQ